MTGAPATPSGSRASTEPSCTVSALTGFDPSHIADVLGPAQRKVLLSLGEDWGKASDHQCAKRMWYGIRRRGRLRFNRYIYLIEHKHQTDNCWRLNDLGVAVRTAIAMEARQRTDREDGLDPKGDSAGPKDIAPQAKP